MFHYLKYFGFHAIGPGDVAAYVAGGHSSASDCWRCSPSMSSATPFAGTTRPLPPSVTPILTAQLWLALPLLSLMVSAGQCRLSQNRSASADRSPAGRLRRLAPRTTVAVRPRARCCSNRLMIGVIGTVAGHELQRHPHVDPVSSPFGRSLLASVSSTPASPSSTSMRITTCPRHFNTATAPHSRNVYLRIVASTIKSNRSAWKIGPSASRRRLAALPGATPSSAAS